jgi:hypothetical protein
MEILYAQNSSIPIINKIIGEVGKIEMPPIGLLKTIENRIKNGQRISPKQRKLYEDWKARGYNAYQSKNAFGNDFNGKVAQELHGMLFTKDASNVKLDDWANAIQEDQGQTTNDEAMILVMDELNQAAKGKHSQESNILDPEYEASDVEIQNMEFDRANKYQFGRWDMTPRDMPVGAIFTIEGESFTLTSKSGNQATLEDGPSFGTQVVPLDKVLWFDSQEVLFEQSEIDRGEQIVDAADEQGYESPDEYLDNETGESESDSERNVQGAVEQAPGVLPDDQGAARGGESQEGSGRDAVNRPATKTDTENLAAKQDFGGNDFKLIQDEIVDPETIAREKREAAEAKAAQDAAQTDMFADSPEPAPKLSEADQALIDAMKDMVDGLEAMAKLIHPEIFK